MIFFPWKIFLSTCAHSFASALSPGEGGWAGGAHLSSPRVTGSPGPLLCYVAGGQSVLWTPSRKFNPVNHPAGHHHGTPHVLSVWLSGNLTTLPPSSRLLILCCHEWQGCKEDSSNCRGDLIPPMSHWAPGLQVNSQQRSHGGLAFYSQGRKQSLLAAEETAPLGTNYSVTL